MDSSFFLPQLYWCPSVSLSAGLQGSTGLFWLHWMEENLEHCSVDQGKTGIPKSAASAMICCEGPLYPASGSPSEGEASSEQTFNICTTTRSVPLPGFAGKTRLNNSHSHWLDQSCQKSSQPSLQVLIACWPSLHPRNFSKAIKGWTCSFRNILLLFSPILPSINLFICLNQMMTPSLQNSK